MKFFILLLISFQFISCKKEYIVETSSEFVGEWHSIPITSSDNLMVYEDYFIIDGQNGVYREGCLLGTNDCGTSYQGPARINKKESKMWVGKVWEGNGRVIIHIDKYPFINDDGKWECTLSQTVFIKN